MPPRKIHMLSWSSSLGIYPPLKAEIDTHSIQPKHVALQERAMDIKYLYLWGNENGEKLGFWLLSTTFLHFKCLPRLCCTSADCISLDWQSSVFSINLQRNYWKALVWCVSHKPHRAAMAMGWTQHSLLNALGNGLVLSGTLNKLSQIKLLRAQYNYIFFSAEVAARD